MKRREDAWCTPRLSTARRRRHILFTAAIVASGAPAVCMFFDQAFRPAISDEKSRYEINFKFAKILYDFLNKKGKNETFERIYNTVSQKTDAFLVKVENWKNNLSKSKSKNDNINDLKEIIKTTKDSQFYIEEDFKEAFKGVDVHNPNNSDLEDAYQTFFDELLNYPVIA